MVETKRYFIYLAYNGEQYCGWQIQPHDPSVQETIEKALSTLLRTTTAIVGAGRTDSGVHARAMVAHFDSQLEDLDVQLLADKLNRMLPKDIIIYKIVEVASDAHARFDARARLYRYYISASKDPFYHQLKYKLNGPLDVAAMNRCAAILFEYTNFKSFSKAHTDVKTFDCTILQAYWEQDGCNYVFTIQANRFLRNMVRSLVGTLLDAGSGKLDETGMRRIIEAQNRCAAGASVPSKGLFLEEIEYDTKINKL